MHAPSWSTSLWLILFGLLLPLGTMRAADDLLITDFEGDTYAPWVVTGEAFGPGPAHGTLPGQMTVEGYKGARLVNSFFQGDGTTGQLTSPEFRIERKWIAFLIGGGKNPEKLSIQLMIDSKVVRSSTGPNDQPGGSEALAPDAWDVSEFQGKLARIMIVDQATGGWGHINVDHITQTDQPPRVLRANVERSFPVRGRYLQIPIKNGAPKRKVTLMVDGQAVVRNDIELADGEPDWWAPLEISSWKGRELTLQVDKLLDDSTALSSIEQTETLKDAEQLYQEPLRGQFHFSPRRGWNNDPNGLVYFNGEYHLFFQHNPYGWGWGNMHWGHAVSRDLVHWQELGDTLSPDEMGPMFSGSAVVDWNNTSGFGRDGKPPLVLFYTAAGNPTTQCLAWSLDGRTFTKYVGNPILKEVTGGNRDPKVIWHAPSKRWVMVLYVEKPAGRHTVHFFTSPNLKDWTFASHVDGDPQGQRFLYECPDFFELAVDGRPDLKKWVLLGADSNYAIGTFDGTRFTAEATHLPGQRGRGFYAAQSFSDIPAEDGRRILVGWFQTETRGMPFNQSMTIPLELGLINTPEGPRMTFTPARELQQLRRTSHKLEPVTLTPGAANPMEGLKAELIELRTEFEPDPTTTVTFNVRGVPIVYDAASQTLSVNDVRAPAPLVNGRQRLSVYADRTGLEVFASEGRTYVPLPININPEVQTSTLSVEGGNVEIQSLELHELQSAWERP